MDDDEEACQVVGRVATQPFTDNDAKQNNIARASDIVDPNKAVGHIDILLSSSAGPAQRPGKKAIRPGINTVGRNPDSDVHIPSLNVSWNHAIIEVVDDIHMLYDLNSTRGTQRKEMPLKPEVRYELMDNDWLTFAGVVCANYHITQPTVDKKAMRSAVTESEFWGDGNSDSQCASPTFLGDGVVAADSDARPLDSTDDAALDGTAHHTEIDEEGSCLRRSQSVSLFANFTAKTPTHAPLKQSTSSPSFAAVAESDCDEAEQSDMSGVQDSTAKAKRCFKKNDASALSDVSIVMESQPVANNERTAEDRSSDFGLRLEDSTATVEANESNAKDNTRESSQLLAFGISSDRRPLRFVDPDAPTRSPSPEDDCPRISKMRAQYFDPDASTPSPSVSERDGNQSSLADRNDFQDEADETDKSNLQTSNFLSELGDDNDTQLLVDLDEDIANRAGDAGAPVARKETTKASSDSLLSIGILANVGNHSNDRDGTTVVGSDSSNQAIVDRIPRTPSPASITVNEMDGVERTLDVNASKTFDADPMCQVLASLEHEKRKDRGQRTNYSGNNVKVLVNRSAVNDPYGPTQPCYYSGVSVQPQQRAGLAEKRTETALVPLSSGLPASLSPSLLTFSSSLSRQTGISERKAPDYSAASSSKISCDVSAASSSDAAVEHNDTAPPKRRSNPIDELLAREAGIDLDAYRKNRRPAKQAVNGPGTSASANTRNKPTNAVVASSVDNISDSARLEDLVCFAAPLTSPVSKPIRPMPSSSKCAPDVSSSDSIASHLAFAQSPAKTIVNLAQNDGVTTTNSSDRKRKLELADKPAITEEQQHSDGQAASKAKKNKRKETADNQSESAKMTKSSNSAAEPSDPETSSKPCLDAAPSLAKTRSSERNNKNSVSKEVEAVARTDAMQSCVSSTGPANDEIIVKMEIITPKSQHSLWPNATTITSAASAKASERNGSTSDSKMSPASFVPETNAVRRSSRNRTAADESHSALPLSAAPKVTRRRKDVSAEAVQTKRIKMEPLSPETTSGGRKAAAFSANVNSPVAVGAASERQSVVVKNEANLDVKVEEFRADPASHSARVNDGTLRASGGSKRRRGKQLDDRSRDVTAEYPASSLAVQAEEGDVKPKRSLSSAKVVKEAKPCYSEPLPGEEGQIGSSLPGNAFQGEKNSKQGAATNAESLRLGDKATAKQSHPHKQAAKVEEIVLNKEEEEAEKKPTSRSGRRRKTSNDSALDAMPSSSSAVALTATVCPTAATPMRSRGRRAVAKPPGSGKDSAVVSSRATPSPSKTAKTASKPVVNSTQRKLSGGRNQPPLLTSQASVDSSSSADFVSKVDLEKRRQRLSSIALLGSADSPGAWRQISYKPRVMLTLFDSDDQQDYYEKIVTGLGGTLETNNSQCTHLVATRIGRTCKMLCAFARGIPIVSPKWLDNCKANGRFLGTSEDLLVDKDIPHLALVLREAKGKPLLKGYRFTSTPHVAVQGKHLREIIQCAGGEYTDSIPKKFEENLIVIAHPDDEAYCKRELPADIPIVTAEFLFTGLFHRRLDQETYRLFAPAKPLAASDRPYQKAARPSTSAAESATEAGAGGRSRRRQNSAARKGDT